MFELFCVLAIFTFVVSIPAVLVAIPTFTDTGSERYSRAMYMTHRPASYRAIMAPRDDKGRFVRS